MPAKVLIVSHVIPPASSGQAVVLYKLLRSIPEQNYILATAGKYQRGIASVALPVKTFHLPTYGRIQRALANKLWLPVELVLFCMTILKRAKVLRCLLTQEKCDSLMICTGDFADMAAGYLVAQKDKKLHLLPYYFDYFAYQFPGVYRRVALWLEKRVMGRANSVVVPNEFMANRLEARYGVRVALVRNPVEIKRAISVSQGESLEKVILYTGAVYEAQLDSLLVLIRALSCIKKYSVKFRIVTTQSKEELRSLGILESSQVGIYRDVPQVEAVKMQAQSNMLFLPLSSVTTYPEIINTSCPGKLAEYLASSRPIFALVPRESFVAWYLNENRAGFVSFDRDEEIVARQLEEAFSQVQESKEMTTRAYAMAKKDFSLTAASRRFLSVITSE